LKINRQIALLDQVGDIRLINDLFKHSVIAAIEATAMKPGKALVMKAQVRRQDAQAFETAVHAQCLAADK
jgi:hypothetical protein